MIGVRVGSTIFIRVRKQVAAGLKLFKSGENLALSSALAAIMLIPLAEILLRAAFHIGISGSASLYL